MAKYYNNMLENEIKNKKIYYSGKLSEEITRMRRNKIKYIKLEYKKDNKLAKIQKENKEMNENRQSHKMKQQEEEATKSNNIARTHNQPSLPNTFCRSSISATTSSSGCWDWPRRSSGTAPRASGAPCRSRANILRCCSRNPHCGRE